MSLAKSLRGILHDVQDDRDLWVNCYIITFIFVRLRQECAMRNVSLWIVKDRSIYPNSSVNFEMAFLKVA